MSQKLISKTDWVALAIAIAFMAIVVVHKILTCR